MSSASGFFSVRRSAWNQLLSGVRQPVGILVLMIIFGLWAVWQGQDASWDLRGYHYYNAFAFLHHRLFNWDIVPAHQQTFYNPLFDLLNYFVIKYMPSAVWAEFILGSFHGIAVYFLVKIAFCLIRTERPGLRYFYVAVAVLLGVTGVASVMQIGTAYNESQVTIFVMASVFLVLQFINGVGAQRIYFCLFAGLILGLAVGLKQTAVSYAFALFLALLCYQKLDLKQLKLIFFTGIVFLLGFSLTGGFWMWILYQQFHNPLFPFYNNFFHSPFVAHDNFIYAIALPPTFKQALLYPFYWLHVTSRSSMARDPRITATFILGMVFIGHWAYQKLINKSSALQTTVQERDSVRFVCLFYYLSYFFWLFEFAIYRFTIPIDFLAGLLIVYFCMRLLQPLFWQVFAVIMVSLILMFTTKHHLWAHGRIPYSKNFFEVTVPKVPANAMVILVGTSPIAYLIPDFPTDTRFVALRNFFVNTDKTIFFQRETLAAIQNHQGPLYVLVDAIDPLEPAAAFGVAQKAYLRQFGLVRLDNKCQMVTSNMERAAIPLCTVIKESG